MMESKIAILLGAYNAEQYLEAQLDSLLNQSYKNWVLYIRDDASSDNTIKIIDTYAKRYDNIINISDSLGNLGCNGNYFHLLEIVDADYYMFCNADDVWVDDKIQITMKKMMETEGQNPGKPIIINTDLIIADSELNVIYPSLWDFNNLDPNLVNDYNFIGICSFVSGATMLFNKKVKNLTFPVVDNAPFFDHWMSLQVAKAEGIIIPLRVPTVYYRQIGTNLAAIMTGNKNTVTYKILNFRDTFIRNRREAKMLKSIGWGGYVKYLYYKFRILKLLRTNRKAF